MTDSFWLAESFPSLGDPLDWPIIRFDAAIKYLVDKAREKVGGPGLSKVNRAREEWERRVLAGEIG